LPATQQRLQWWTGDVVRLRWRTGARGNRGSQQQESWTEAERPELGLGEPETTHCWTETTCLAEPLACSDWSHGEERDVGRLRLDQVEGGGDNGKQGRTGSQLRCAVAGVLVCAVVALVITPRCVNPYIACSKDAFGISDVNHAIVHCNRIGDWCAGHGSIPSE
jgi:hypothetical protein